MVLGGVAVALVIVAAGYGAFVESAKQPSSSYSTIGTLGIEVTPRPSSAGTELFELTYNAVGVWDFTGWQIMVDGTPVHTLQQNSVPAGGTVTICGQAQAGVDCTAFFAESDIFPDTGAATVTLVDTVGSVAGSITYSDPAVGDSFYEAPSLKTTVLADTAAIDLCHSANGNNFTSGRANAKNIVGGKAHATHQEFDIIPPFFYKVDGVVGHYAGLNWPDATGRYAAGCTSG